MTTPCPITTIQMSESLKAIVRSLRDGKLEEVKGYYEQNPDAVNDCMDIDYTDPEFEDLNSLLTALQIATSCGHYELVKYLLSFPNIDVNCKDDFSMSPFLVAMRRLDIAKLFLERPDVSIIGLSVFECSAFHVAVGRGYLELLEILLSDLRFDPNLLYGPEECNALHLACCKSKDYSSSIKSLELLLSCDRIDVNKRSGDGKLPFTYAIQRGNYQAAKMLLNHDRIRLSPNDTTIWDALCDKTDLIDSTERYERTCAVLKEFEIYRISFFLDPEAIVANRRCMTYPIRNLRNQSVDTSILDVCCQSYMEVALSIYIPLYEKLELSLNCDVVGLIWSYISSALSSTLRINDSADRVVTIQEWVNNFKESTLSKHMRRRPATVKETMPDSWSPIMPRSPMYDCWSPMSD